MRPLHRLLLTLLVASAPLTVMADRTTRGKLRAMRQEAASAPAATTPYDTIVPSSGMLTLSGYDKPLRSRRESIFITNRSRRTVVSVTLRIDYLDMEGRQMHRAEVTLPCDIPAGETRQLNFPTWDRQQAFYYHVTGKPRTSDGSPYTITATPTGCIVEH